MWNMTMMLLVMMMWSHGDWSMMMMIRMPVGAMMRMWSRMRLGRQDENAQILMLIVWRHEDDGGMRMWSCGKDVEP